MYLEADEDHPQGLEAARIIGQKNLHKIAYLQRENAQLKALLDEAEKNLELNKNMIKLVIDNQESNSAKLVQDNNQQVIKKINQENVILHQ